MEEGVLNIEDRVEEIGIQVKEIGKLKKKV